MFRREVFCRLELHNQLVIHQHIHKVITNTESIIVEYFKRLLPLYLITCLDKPMFQRILINLLKQPIPKVLMYPIRHLPHL